jgi:hypothetical protein
VRYTYDTFTYDSNSLNEKPRRTDTTTNFDEAHLRAETAIRYGNYSHTVVSDGLKPESLPRKLSDGNSWADWRMKLERDAAWKPEKEHIEPLPDHKMNTLTIVEDDGFHSVDMQKEFTHMIGADIPLAELNTKISTIEKSVNPSHYKTHAEFCGQTFQWLETNCREGRFLRNPDQFVAAVELQVRKYLDRCGQKEGQAELREMASAMWYLMFSVAYVKNGKKPIMVRDIAGLLADFMPR